MGPALHAALAAQHDGSATGQALARLCIDPADADKHVRTHELRRLSDSDPEEWPDQHYTASAAASGAAAGQAADTPSTSDVTS